MNHHSQVHFARVPIFDIIIGTRVSGQPVFFLKVFPKCLEHRERHFHSISGNLAHEFPVAFYDRKIVIVHPHYALKIPVLPAQLFRLHLEDVEPDAETTDRSAP